MALLVNDALDCDCECKCLQYVRDENKDFNYDLHIRFDDPINGYNGTHVVCNRTTDPHIWYGTSGSGVTRRVYGIRVTQQGRPRVMFLGGSSATSLTHGDFEGLNHRDGVLFECKDSLLIDMFQVLEGMSIRLEGLTFTAHATTTDVTLRQFSISGTNNQDATELYTCLTDSTYGIKSRVNVYGRRLTITPTGPINFLGYITSCPKVVQTPRIRLQLISLNEVKIDATVTINGLTYTAKSATNVSAREFAITTGSATGTLTDDENDATQLALCINDPTYGVPGVYALQANNGPNLALAVQNLSFPTVTASASVVIYGFTLTTREPIAGTTTDTVNSEFVSMCLDFEQINPGYVITVPYGPNLHLGAPAGSLTYTAHATTTTISSRQFSVAGSTSDIAAAFASCVNDFTYGIPDFKAAVFGSRVVLCSTALTYGFAAFTISPYEIKLQPVSWTLISSQNQNLSLAAGVIVDSGYAVLDGISAFQRTTTGTPTYDDAPNNAWCKLSITPDTLTVKFQDWKDGSGSIVGPYGVRRSNFNGVFLSLALIGTPSKANGRMLSAYGYNGGAKTVGAAGVFYSDSVLSYSTCIGVGFPRNTVFWLIRAEVNQEYPLITERLQTGVSDATHAGQVWTNPTFAVTNDANSATVNGGPGGVSEWLKLTNRLTVTSNKAPNNARLKRVTLTVRRFFTGAGSTVDETVHLVRSGTVETAVNKASASAWPGVETATTYVWSESELGSWATADINASTSGFVISVTKSATGIASLQYAEIEYEWYSLGDATMTFVRIEEIPVTVTTTCYDRNTASGQLWVKFLASYDQRTNDGVGAAHWVKKRAASTVALDDEIYYTFITLSGPSVVRNNEIGNILEVD